MKQNLLKTWLMLVCLIVGVGTSWAESFSTTYDYGLSNWSLTNYTDQSSYYQVPTGTGVNSSVATISGIFSGKTITSDVVVTINCATYGSGTNPSASTFSLYKETACTNAIAATQGGTLPSSSTYTNVTYTIAQANAASLGNDLAVKITKPGKTIRLKSIKVAFTYTASGGGSTPTALSVPSNLSSSNVTTTGATLSWNAVSSASSYTVKIGETEYTNVNTNSYSATGLTAGTQYTWTVKAVGDGVSYSTSAYAANANFTTETEQGGGGEPGGAALTVDFESETSAYTDWTFTNITTKQTNSNVKAHGGSYFGTTGGKETGSVQTKDKVNPKTITFYISKISTNTTSSDWKIQTSTNGTSWTDAKTASASSVTRGSWTEVTHTFSGVSNVYVRVYYTGSTAVRCIDDLTLTLADDPSKTTPTLSYENSTYNATMGEGFTAPTLTNSESVAVTYSSSKPTVATVNATTGAITLIGPGTTTITASFDGDETYNAASANYNLVVSPAPFASLEDLVAADLESNTLVTVSFENVSIRAFQTKEEQRVGVYFNIVKGGGSIEIYYPGIPNEWVEGGTLSGTMTCPWKLYSSTWELAPESGSWDWSSLTYNAPANYAPAITTQPVGATYDLNASATNLTVAANGNPVPTYQWYSNTTNSNENGTELTGETNASYKPSTTVAGTFYYYCVATNSEGSATSNVATIKVNEPATVDLPFSFDGGKSNIASIDGMTQSGLGTDYASSPKLKFDSQGDNVIIHFGEAAKKVTYTIKGNSTSGTYAFDVMESANGVDYTIVHSHTSITDGAYTDNLTSTSRFVKFVYTTKADGNVALGKINIIAASYREEPNLAFDKATYKFIAGKTMQVVASSKAGSTGAITYALTAGDEDAFAINENTGEITCETAGTYTVTATIAETADYYSRTATCTVNILEPIVGNSIIVAEANGEYYAMKTTCAGEYFTHKAIKKVGDKYVVNSLDDILFYTNTAEGKTTIQSTTNNEYVQATAAKKVSYTENEYKWTNDGEKLTAATASYGTLQYNTSSPRFTTYATKVGQYATIVDVANVVVGDAITLVATDGVDYYATFSSNEAAEFTDAEVYTVTVDGGVLTLNEVTSKKVPANTGVLIKCTENQAIYVPTNSAVDLGSNMLHPASEAKTGDNKFYMLAYASSSLDNLGFYWGAADGAAFESRAGSAYLAVPTSSGAAVRGFAFNGGEATAITEVKSEELRVKNLNYYNLNGQRINGSVKGIVIVNGKKVLK